MNLVSTTFKNMDALKFQILKRVVQSSPHVNTKRTILQVFCKFQNCIDPTEKPIIFIIRVCHVFQWPEKHYPDRVVIFMYLYVLPCRGIKTKTKKDIYADFKSFLLVLSLLLIIFTIF